MGTSGHTSLSLGKQSTTFQSKGKMPYSVFVTTKQKFLKVSSVKIKTQQGKVKIKNSQFAKFWTENQTLVQHLLSKAT